MMLQSYFLFPVLNRNTKNIDIFRYLTCFQRSLYLITVKLLKVRNNLFDEMNPEWGECTVSKNTCFQQIFMGTETMSKENFLL